MRVLALVVLGMSAVGLAPAGTIDFTTVNNAANWQVQWNDGTNTYTGTPFNLPPPLFTDISITSTSFRPSAGQPADIVGGVASTGNWNGVWIGTFTFVLPSTFFDPQLAISQLFTDDRMVIFLNNTIVADRVVILNGQEPSGPGTLYTSLTGTTNQPHTFVNQSSYLITNPALFLPGLNTIRIIVNNTGNNGLSSQTTNFAADADRSAVRIEGLITYTEIPEPSTWATLGAGLLGLGFLARRRR